LFSLFTLFSHVSRFSVLLNKMPHMFSILW
jgi:hypothetical protein